MRTAIRAAALVAAGLLVSACSIDVATYTIGRYGEVKGLHVHLGCHDTYEVFDRPKAGRLLVVTNGVNEALAGCGEAALPRSARMRRVAELFLSENSNRSACLLGDQVELSPFHAEITYRCPSGDERPGLGRRR